MVRRRFSAVSNHEATTVNPFEIAASSFETHRCAMLLRMRRERRGRAASRTHLTVVSVTIAA
jgi:hypothetical protein